MKLPMLSEIKKSKTTISAFKGINKSSVVAKDYFYDEENITSEKYPLAVTRTCRTLYKDFGAPVQGIAYRNGKLLYIKDGIVYFGTDENGEDMPLNGEDNKLSDGAKEIVSMGSYAIIYPDKVYFNTLGETDEESGVTEYKLRDMEFHMHLCTDPDYDSPLNPSQVSVSFGLVEAGSDEGTCMYPGVFSGGEEPVGADIDTYWLDSNYTLKMYVAEKGESYTITNPQLVMKISSPALVRDYAFNDLNPISELKIGDSLTFNFSGLISGTFEIRNIFWESRPYSNGIFSPIIVVIDYPSDFNGKELFLKSGHTTCESGDIDINVPEIKFLTEDANRLWGVDESNGEIRACKQGDFRAWDTYSGLTSDSYAVTIGTDGSYTGCCKYGSNLLFFKQNSLCKLCGNKPANYQVTFENNLRTVQKGSHMSPQVIGDILYYKSDDCICAYDGSDAVNISLALGEDMYENAVSCAYADKYFIAMTNTNSGKRELFVYDTLKGFWNRMDCVNILSFLIIDGGLYAVEGVDDGNGVVNRRIIGLENASGTPMEDSVSWEITSGDIGIESNQLKYISGVSFTFDAKGCSSVELLFSVNGGDFVRKHTFVCDKLHSHCVPVRLPRCDRFSWRLRGEGEFRLFAVNYYTEEGSEVDVCI